MAKKGIISRKTIVYDGMKAIDLWNGDRGGDIISGGSSDGTQRMTAQDYFVSVPWLYRAVKDRATCVKKVAFAIVNEKGDDIDASATWQNELDIFPYPRRLIHQIEESLVMTGRAYLFLETNGYSYVKAVKYCLPTSITEVFDKDTGDLLYYERRVNGKTKRVAPLNMVAIYDPDYTVEQGPGKSSAAKAALLAADVLFNTDRFIAMYFQRGAIKATILAVDTADQKEANRLQAWWEDTIAGKLNAWAAQIIRGKTVTPTIVGQGLEGLENDSLTASKRQDISTAIGVPESRMWAASANFATADVENEIYFNDVIVPECWLIEEAFNAQLFTAEHKMQGYRWEFRPEISEGFSDDQSKQATAFVAYVGSGMLPSIAAQIVGLELPGEMEYEDLDPEEVEPVAPVIQVLPGQEQGQLPPPEEKPVDAQAVRSALYNWKAAALASVKTGHDAGIDFDNPCIPVVVYDFLHYELTEAKDAPAVNDLFKQARDMCKGDIVDPVLILAQEIKLAREALVNAD